MVKHKHQLSARLWLVGLGLFLSATASSRLLAQESSSYYAIRIGENLIGYSVVAAVDDSSADVQSIRSLTKLKIGLLGKERRMRFDSLTHVDPQTGRPRDLQSTVESGEIVQTIHCRLTAEQAQISTQIGDTPSSQEKTVKLPEDFLMMGNNDFYHWDVLAHRLGESSLDEVSLAVLSPATLQMLDVAAKRTGAGELTLEAKTYATETWRLEGLDADLVIDASSSKMLQLILPSQDTTIELTTAKIQNEFETAPLEEILAKHFVDSNVRFDEPLEVTLLEADIDVNVIGSGVENAPEVLQTSMQSFDGTKEQAHIVGKVKIQSRPVDTEKVPAFPSDSSGLDVEKQYLQPEPLIESDEASIRTLAKQLTGEATNRWEAVEKIATWVHKEIAYEIADTPSAVHCLENRKGDCGPHSTLTVALLRASGIPAKLVGGLVYTPSFGGTFGQHAWVEVDLGEQGWVALDPTTGELQQISATHIKLFEGMGGVVPNTLNVVAYQPQPSADTPVVAKVRDELPWQLGETYRYRYRQGNQDLGTEEFTIKARGGDGEGYDINAKLQLTAPGTDVDMQTRLTTTQDGRPLSYLRKAVVDQKKIEIAGDFHDDKVQVNISGSVRLDREMELPKDIYCFDNNFIPSFSLMAAFWTLEPKSTFNVQTFHPSSLQVIKLTVKVGEEKTLPWQGQEVTGFECHVDPLNNNFFISNSGQLLRVSQGPLVIELIPSQQ